jgi:isoaspartyl peptidase/L-asparaginase-like protein (Ntn-hydrolase superfamily)
MEAQRQVDFHGRGKKNFAARQGISELESTCAETLGLIEAQERLKEK